MCAYMNGRLLKELPPFWKIKHTEHQGRFWYIAVATSLLPYLFGQKMGFHFEVTDLKTDQALWLEDRSWVLISFGPSCIENIIKCMKEIKTISSQASCKEIIIYCMKEIKTISSWASCIEIIIYYVKEIKTMCSEL